MAMTEHEGLQIYKDASGNSFILYPITKVHLVDGLDEFISEKVATPLNHVNAKNNPHNVTAEQVGAATTKTITVSVGTSWIADTTNGGYYQTSAATGIVAGDNPVVDVILGSDVEANALYKESWACVDRVVTAANSVTIYANEKAPTTAFTFQVKVVR